MLLNKMSSMEQEEIGAPIDMPVGWSEAEKDSFGMANNSFSFIVGGLTVLCFLLCVICYVFPDNSSKIKPLRDMMHSPSGAIVFLAVSFVALFLALMHLNYERLVGFSILTEDEQAVIPGMTAFLFAWGLMRFICCCMCSTEKPTKLCNTACSIGNSPIVGLFAVAAAVALLYYTSMQFEREESIGYKNLEEPVPVMESPN